MLIIPAIDIKNGRAVRLEQGDMDKETVFSDDPAAVAAHWLEQGARRLHLVDLNGAVAGKPRNESVIKDIVSAVGGKIPIQLGGGIRDLDTVDTWLDAGITRVILGTVALRDPALVREACARHPGRVAVGIDARDGFVAVEGWAEVSQMKAVDLARAFEDAGVAAIIYTDISRDGAMQGPNVEATLALARAVTTPVVLSGGVSSMADLEAVKAAADGVLEGVISGRAVYDGRIDPARAVELLQGAA